MSCSLVFIQSDMAVQRQIMDIIPASNAQKWSAIQMTESIELPMKRGTETVNLVQYLKSAYRNASDTISISFKSLQYLILIHDNPIQSYVVVRMDKNHS